MDGVTVLKDIVAVHQSNGLDATRVQWDELVYSTASARNNFSIGNTAQQNMEGHHAPELERGLILVGLNDQYIMEWVIYGFVAGVVLLSFIYKKREGRHPVCDNSDTGVNGGDLNRRFRRDGVPSNGHPAGCLTVPMIISRARSIILTFFIKHAGKPLHKIIKSSSALLYLEGFGPAS